MARFQLEQRAYIPHVGGIYVVGAMKHLLTTEGTITLDFKTMNETEFRKIIKTVRHGFSTSRESAALAVLRMLRETNAPKIPEIGYLGKRDMSVLVAAQNVDQYKTDLIAAGHLMDVDLSQAVSVGTQVSAPDGTRLASINVDSYKVSVSGQNALTSTGSSWQQRTRARKAGLQLRPATSKMANMIKQWTLETYHTRSPLIDFLNTRPCLTWSLSST